MAIEGLERFEPNVEQPGDFTRFWAQTVAELQDIAPQPVTEQEETTADGLRLARLRYKSLGGASIRGYLLRPAAASRGGDRHTPGKRPLIVHAHGYNDRFQVMHDWARRGFSVCGFDARGFGRSAEAASVAPEGYVLTGIASPEHSILRGAVADFLQTLRAARELLDGEVSDVCFYGFSFGGALALMASALSRDPEFVVLGQPTFGWHEERHRLALAGSALEVKRYVTRFPWRRDQVLQTLKMFDTLHFAPLVNARTLVGIGLDDMVVPSRTVLAVVNRFRHRLEARLLPVSHSNDAREVLWQQFHDEWLGYMAHGLPADFGAASRQVRALAA
jgi:cephalosporin-C deacetylase